MKTSKTAINRFLHAAFLVITGFVSASLTSLRDSDESRKTFTFTVFD